VSPNSFCDNVTDTVPKIEVKTSFPIEDVFGASQVKMTIIIVKMLLAEWLKW
jgi:hypothetical protein